MPENQEFTRDPHSEFWSEGNWEALLPLVQADLEAAHREGDLEREAEELAGLSFLHGELGHHQESVRIRCMELRLRKRFGDPGEIAQTLWTLSLDLKLVGRINSAIRCKRMALAYFKNIGEKEETPLLLSNLGLLLHQAGRSAEALAAFQEALAYDPPVANYPGWSAPRILQEMAAIHEVLGDLQSAYACRFQANAGLHATAGQEFPAAEGLLRLGRIQRTGGKEWEAQEYFREAMETFRRLGISEKAEEARILLIEARTSKNRFLRNGLKASN